MAITITDQYGDPDLHFAGHQIAVECIPLSIEAEAQIENYANSGNTGSAKVACVVAAVDRLYVDGKPESLVGQKQFRRLRDRETGTSLLEFLLMYVVDHEPWLASSNKWPGIFKKYLNNPIMAELNPTKSQDGTQKAS